MTEHEDPTGLWAFIHATGAGLVPVFVWETIRTVAVDSVTVCAYGVITYAVIHAIIIHRRHLKRARSTDVS